ncbi:MAG: hypothetical protein ACI9FN_001536 [Saprospiraceae bacterium]|jgi:hypothetical protein
MNKLVNTITIAAMLLLIVSCGTPKEKSTLKVEKKEATATSLKAQEQDNYSPYVGDNYPQDVYFGDTHLHTSYSTDAGMVGNVLGPEDAYRFAMGELVKQSHGLNAQLQRPLDFLVISDHAENLGLSPAIEASNPELLKNEWARKVHDLVKSGEGIAAYDAWMDVMRARKDPLKGSQLASAMWADITAAAEKYNSPGKFTAFIGYEWTSMPGGNNLHRNIIFRDGKDKADQIVPFSAYDGEDPEDLWDWMAAYEKKTNGHLLALAHNGNISNGLMFDDVTLTDKKAIDKDYAERRMRWEPIYEVTQMKGDGEANPDLSPNDEFADFETWDKGSFGPDPKTPAMLPKEYARAAYKRGLKYEEQLGVNPFKFGMVGSTDSHTSLATTTENNAFGKVEPLYPSNEEDRFHELITGRIPSTDGSDIKVRAWQTSASGLAAVWATENTREGLWDAMKRKEVYATTGTRMKVRVFAGYDFKKVDLKRPDFAKYGYKNGVPMGADLTGNAETTAPVLLIKALKDPDWANLDRVQVIKGWLDAEGNTHEQIYDVAMSDGRVVAADGRCKTPVGNTVNGKEATFDNSIGEVSLEAYWQDPEFDPSQRAFYYVRVLEIPTPRWTTFDAKYFGTEIPEGAPISIQDRAYTSPIWYTPQSK